MRRNDTWAEEAHRRKLLKHKRNAMQHHSLYMMRMHAYAHTDIHR